MRLYLSRIEGPPPKRNAPGSNPGKRAKNNAETLYFIGFSALFFVCLRFRLDGEARLYFSSYFAYSFYHYPQLAC